MLLDAATVFLALISSLGGGAAGDVCFSNCRFLCTCSERFRVHLLPVSALARTFLDICALAFRFFLLFPCVPACATVCVRVFKRETETERASKKGSFDSPSPLWGLGFFLFLFFCFVFFSFLGVCVCTCECACNLSLLVDRLLFSLLTDSSIKSCCSSNLQ